MPLRTRLAAALLTALAAGFALMAHDRSREAGWAVTPAQVADAKAAGKPGVELAPGRFATEPIPVGEAWLLPVKWVLVGLGAGFAVLAATGLRKRPAGASDRAARDFRRVPPDRRL